MNRLPLVCHLVATLATAAPSPPTVEVPGLGSLVGRGVPAGASGDIAVAYFVGIPYAKAPVGDLRWRAPEPYGAWQSPRQATQFGAACIGAADDTSLDIKDLVTSEDCLFLNIAAPLGALGGSARLPVMVWIHGGSFSGGTAQGYPAERFAAKAGRPVVVVTLNYRVGVQGFLGSQRLRERDHPGRYGTGNYGIQDQRLALQWVSQHIGAFGGDKRRVTIFGQSAGGSSVLHHLVQAASFGLYSQAIVQSGTYGGSIPLRDSEANFQLALETCHCSDAACLLQCSSETLHNVTLASGHWGPVIDGIWMNASELDLIRSGQFNAQVPVIIGANRDEYGVWVRNLAACLTSQAAVDQQLLDPSMAHLNLTTPARRQLFEAYYTSKSYNYPRKLGGYSKWWWAFIRMVTDQVMGACSVRRVARALASHGAPGVYVYSFQHPAQAQLPSDIGFPGNVVAGHGGEEPFLWNDPSKLNGSEESRLAKQLAASWATFAATGNPGRTASIAWPAYNTSSDLSLLLDVASAGGVTITSAFRKGACDLWDSLDEASVSPLSLMV